MGLLGLAKGWDQLLTFGPVNVCKLNLKWNALKDLKRSSSNWQDTGPYIPALAADYREDLGSNPSGRNVLRVVRR